MISKDKSNKLDVAGLRKAITSAILATGYIPTEDGSITVDLQYKDADVIVRPDNMLSRFYWLNQPWYLMIIFFWVVPLIWIWSHIDQRRAGGPYEVAVASYGLKVYPALPGTYANERVEQAKHRLPGLFKLYPFIPRDPFLHQGPKGVHYLLGRKEGEWFREWEVSRAGRSLNRADKTGAHPDGCAHEVPWRADGHARVRGGPARA